MTQGGVRPRPPADVVGGEWSLWLILAAVVAAGLLAWALRVAYRRWAGGGREETAPSRGASARAEALRELEEILARGHHRNGRIADFYDASTGALRRFVARLVPGWGPWLTTGELVEHLEDRWAGAATDALGSALATAERAKFGGFRPEPEQAEEDWRTIRDWIRGAPGGDGEGGGRTERPEGAAGSRPVTTAGGEAP